MIILGIDPGSQTTGLAVIEVFDGRLNLLRLGYWRPSCRKWSCRIGELFETVESWLQEYLPDAVVLEEVFVHPQNPRSALVLQQITGAIEAALAHNGYGWVTYPATVIKQSITGSGRADKGTLHRRLKMLFPGMERLSGAPADAWDALAVALCHAYHGGYATPAHHHNKTPEEERT